MRRIGEAKEVDEDKRVSESQEKKVKRKITHEVQIFLRMCNE